MITAAMVKELRERTWIGMMECKKALDETNGDMELAIEELRKKGLAKAAKKADREALEWGIKILNDNDAAYVVSISCETDFLANSDKFKAMLADVCEFLKANGEDSKEAAQKFIDTNYSLELGEKLEVSVYKIIKGDVVASYVHGTGKLAAVVAATAPTDAQKLKNVAMHVTAANPEFLSASEISSEVIEKEKAIQLDIMKNDPKMGGKPDNVLLTIIDGKMDKFKASISLDEQDFVMDPNMKVKTYLGEGKLTSFYRFSV